MAETVFVNVTKAAWVSLDDAAGVQGYISNRSDDDIIVRQADAQPSATDFKGHRIRPGQNLSYKITPPEKVWAITTDDTAEVVVTPGLI